MGTHFNQDDIIFRKPHVEDGSKVWELVKNSGTLDLNSVYCYLVLCKHFSETCVVAEKNNQIVGFVTAYIPLNSPDVLFIWQIGVDYPLRGKGMGLSLLLNLLQRSACQNISFIETTITPNYERSIALFKALPQRLGTQFVELQEFSETLFPEGNHPSEHLFRIGPFNPKQIENEVLFHGNH